MYVADTEGGREGGTGVWGKESEWWHFYFFIFFAHRGEYFRFGETEREGEIGRTRTVGERSSFERGAERKPAPSLSCLALSCLYLFLLSWQKFCSIRCGSWNNGVVAFAGFACSLPRTLSELARWLGGRPADTVPHAGSIALTRTGGGDTNTVYLHILSFRFVPR